MRRLLSLVAVVLLLSASAPMLACVTGGAMTRNESACCRVMNGKCGEMAKQGCCASEVRTDESPQLATSSTVVAVHWTVFAWLGQGTGLPSVSAWPLQLGSAVEHSPPRLLFQRLTVLRI